MSRILKWLPLLLLALWMALPRAVAQPRLQPPLPPELNSEEAGQTLAARLRRVQPEEDAQFRATLKTRSQDGTIRRVGVQCQVRLQQTDWQTIYSTQQTETCPAERVLILHHADEPNKYYLVRGPGDQPLESPAAALAPDRLDHPLAGSDFWLVDLGMDFLHWPRQLLVKTEMRKGRWCHVLESRNPDVATAPYACVRSWLDKETGQPLLAEAYDSHNQLLKEFSIGSLKKVQGHWQVKDMKMSNVQTRSRTWLEFDLPGSD